MHKSSTAKPHRETTETVNTQDMWAPAPALPLRKCMVYTVCAAVRPQFFICRIDSALPHPQTTACGPQAGQGESCIIQMTSVKVNLITLKLKL